MVFWRVHALYLSADSFMHVSSLSLVSYECNSTHASHKLHMYFLRSQPCFVSAGHSCVMYSAWYPKDNYDNTASVFVVQFNGFMSLTS